MLQQDSATEDSMIFWSDGWSRMNPKGSPYKTLVIMVPLDMFCTTSGPWYFHNIIIIIIFPTEVRMWNFLVFWWAGLVPFLVQPLHFSLQILHSSFIWSQCGCQEAVFFYIIAEVPDRCPRTFPPFQESLVDTQWNWTTSWTMWWAEPRLMSNIGTTVFVLTQWFLPNDAFTLCSWLQCYNSVGLSHFIGLCVRHTSFKMSSYVCCGDTRTCYRAAALCDIGCQWVYYPH
jgi:hypothetical protein